MSTTRPKLTPEQRVQERFRERVQDQAEKQVRILMETAVRRACGGREPGSEELAKRGRTFEIDATGQLVVQWDEATILLVSPSTDGLSWSFMGAAETPVPKP